MLESWSDTAGERVVDDQVAYMIWDILRDPVARSQLVWGSQAYAFGFVVPGVETASKTGTTTTSNSNVTKDSLMISFSSAISTVVWNGNHDGSGLWNSDNTIVRRVINNYMESVHKDVYAAEGKWHPGDAPARPAGLQTLTVNGKTDIWPSWYNEKTSGVTKESLKFNKYTKKLASSCTKEEDTETLEVAKTIDPMTNNEVWNIPEGYDRENADDCSYSTPTVSVSRSGTHLSITVNGSAIIGGTYTITDAAGKAVATGKISSASFTPSYTITGKEESLTVTVTDTNGVSSGSRTIAIPASSSSDSSSSSSSSSGGKQTSGS